MPAERHNDKGKDNGKKRQAAKKPPPPPMVNPLPGLNLFTAKVVHGSGAQPLVQLEGGRLWVATSGAGGHRVNYRPGWAADLESLSVLLERMACEAYVRGYNRGRRDAAAVARPKGGKVTKGNV